MKVPSSERLFAAARTIAKDGDEHVPYAFEKRIMAHVRSGTMADFAGSVTGAMWRAALSCLFISALTAAIVSYANPSGAELMATDLERTVLAPVDVDDSW